MASIRDQVVYFQLVNSMALIDELNIQNQRYLKHHNLPCNVKNSAELQAIIDKLPSLFNVNRIKAIVFAIDEPDFSSFLDLYKFRLKCREFCKNHRIFSSFPNQDSLQAFCGISNTKSMVNVGEKVTVIYSFGGFQSLCGTTNLRRKDRFEILKLHATNGKPVEFTQKWKDEYMQNQKPQKIVLVRQVLEDSEENVQKFKELFKAENCVVINEIAEEYSRRSLIDKALNDMGEKFSEYNVANINSNCYAVLIDTAMVFSAVYGDKLPFEDSRILNVKEGNTISLFAKLHASTNIKEILHCYKLFTTEKHEVKVTLKIDINSFYEFKVETINPQWSHELEDCLEIFKDGDKTNEDLIQYQLNNKHLFSDEPSTSSNPSASSSTDKPATSPSTTTAAAKIVFEKQHFTVFTKERERIPIYIAFTEKKPIIGEAAKEVYGTKPNFVVFDIIKLCSVSSAEIMNPKWGFKFEKDGEALMVTVETIEGERLSSVEFLLAIILKHGLKILKNKFGKKMEEIEIGFDGFTPNETLKKNFVEAGKLMKVEIKFC